MRREANAGIVGTTASVAVGNLRGLRTEGTPGRHSPGERGQPGPVRLTSCGVFTFLGDLISRVESYVVPVTDAAQ